MSDVEERKGEVGYRLSYKDVYLPIILILGPLIFLGLLFNILYYTVRVDPVVNLCVVSIGGCVIVVALYSYYLRTADELHGRGTFVLTYREERKRVWSDFALIQEIRDIKGEMEKLVRKTAEDAGVKIPKLGNAKSELDDSSAATDGGIPRLEPETEPEEQLIYPLEVTFQDFVAFEKMIILSPCPKEDLSDFIPDKILWKGFIPMASTACLDVTRVAAIELEGKYIPVVVPTGCSFITEHIQNYTDYFNITRKQIDQIIQPEGLYDKWKCVELKELLHTREAQLASAYASIKDFDGAVEKKVEAERKLFLETFESERNLPKWLKMKKIWLLFGLIAVLGFLIWVMVHR